MKIKKIIAIILIIIALVMLFIGVTKSMLPPALTGIGFILIAIVFLNDKKVI